MSSFYLEMSDVSPDEIINDLWIWVFLVTAVRDDIDASIQEGVKYPN